MSKTQEMNNSDNLNSTKKSNKILGLVLKIIAVLFILLVIACIGIYMWQKDNINAFMYSTKYTSDEIQSQMAESKQNVSNALEEYEVEGIRDLTPEEEDALCRGNLTAEEAVALIFGEDTSSGETSVQNTGGQSGSADESTDTNQNDAKSIVTKYAGEMYSLKATYLGMLGSLAAAAKAQYDTDKQQYGKSKAIENVISNNLSTALGLESECDAAVEGVLAELTAELNAIGVDTSIVDTMRTEYQNEKSLKKSYYLSLKN